MSLLTLSTVKVVLRVALHLVKERFGPPKKRPDIGDEAKKAVKKDHENGPPS